jgi:hypothetical protein
MSGRKEIAKYGENTRFSKTNQPEKRGRKPDKIKKYIQEYDLSSSDVNAILTKILFDHTLGDLEAIIADPEKKNNLVTFIAYVIMILQKSAEKGDIRPLSYFMDRMFGKPDDKVSVSMPLSNGFTMTEEEQSQFDQFIDVFLNKKKPLVKRNKKKPMSKE